MKYLHAIILILSLNSVCCLASAFQTVYDYNEARGQIALGGKKRYEDAKTHLNTSTVHEADAIRFENERNQKEAHLNSLAKKIDDLEPQIKRKERQQHNIEKRLKQLKKEHEGNEKEARNWEKLIATYRAAWQRNKSRITANQHNTAVANYNQFIEDTMKPCVNSFNTKKQELVDVNSSQNSLIERNNSIVSEAKKTQSELNESINKRNQALSRLYQEMAHASAYMESGNKHIEEYARITEMMKQKLFEIGGDFVGFLESLICFPGDTEVSTPEGPRPISEIEPGDTVYACNEESMECREQIVKDVIENSFNYLVGLKINGSFIKMTPAHPVYVKNLGLTEAQAVEEDSTVYLRDDEGVKEVTIEEVIFENLDTPIKVYNLSVENDNNYFVGEQKLLVHNCNINESLKFGSLASSTAVCTYALPACTASIEFVVPATVVGTPAVGGTISIAGSIGACTLMAASCGNAASLVPDFRTMYAKAVNDILPPKTIVKERGVEIKHYTRSGDHGPAHLHVKGGGHEVRIGQNGKPLKGDPELTPLQKEIVEKNIKLIRDAVARIQKWYSRQGY